MADKKIYLLAELNILPEFLEEAKEIFAEALRQTLKEPGCEALHTTSLEGEPNKLIFFEIFSSEEVAESSSGIAAMAPAGTIT